MTRLIAVVAALAVLAIAAGLLLTRPGPGPTSPALTVLCAAGIREPAERAAAAFTAATGQAVRFQFGGSGQLLGSLAAGAPADLFLAADASYLRIAREKGLIRERLALATQRPVIAVPAGNPRGVRGLADLAGLRYGLPNPESASLGRTLKEGLGEAWPALAAGAAVTKPTVTDLVTDLQIGSLDAALLWDANVSRLPGLAAVAASEFATMDEEVGFGVTTSSTQPAAAIALARWMASPEHGAPVWTAAGYRARPGDSWVARPTLKLYSGAVNRLGVEAALKRFAAREGAEITTVFNGCGVLCADMKMLSETKGAPLPDAYFACDLCFVAPVADLFPEAVAVTETDIVVAVAAGDPKGISTLADLAKPGLRVGICNAQQSTLGFMTQRLLQATGLEKAVRRNVVVEVPTADLLTTQLLTGSLDAAIVYAVNVQPHADRLVQRGIINPAAKAVQPFAVAARSPNAQLAQRLLEELLAARAEMEAVGFRFRGDAPIPSASIDPDPASRAGP